MPESCTGGAQLRGSWKEPRDALWVVGGCWGSGGSGCARAAFSNQDLPFHSSPVQDHMAESESQGSLHPPHFFLLFVEKSPVLS